MAKLIERKRMKKSVYQLNNEIRNKVYSRFNVEKESKEKRKKRTIRLTQEKAYVGQSITLIPTLW